MAWRGGALALAMLLLAASVAAAGDASVLHGTAGDDRVMGTDGADSIYGGPGNDELDGAGGSDQLDGGEGADLLHGGPGVDSAVYGDRGPAKVTLDGLANDGVEGEGDLVGDDVEALFTGAGADVLTGGPRGDLLDGGAGDDALDGAEGEDALYGGPGDDRLNAIDGDSDVVDCGEGRDIATLDESDTTSGCESAVRATPRRVRAKVRSSWEIGGGRTRALRIRITGLTRESAIEVRCKGRGCLSRRRVVNGPSGGAVDAARALRGARLARGAKVEVRVLEAGAIGLVVRYTIGGRKGPKRRDLCLPPRKERPVPC